MTLKVRTKLILLIVIPLIASLGIAVLGMASLNSLSTTATRLTQERLIPVLHLEKIVRQYTQNVVDVAHKTRAQMLFWGEAETSLTDARALIREEWQLYLDHDLSEEERAVLEKYPDAVAQAEQVMNTLQGFIEERSSYGMGNYVDLSLYQEIEPVLTLIDELVAVQEQLAKEAGEEATTVASEGSRLLVMALVVTMVFVLFIGWWLNAGINRRMQRLLSVITEIEQNKDLSIRADLPQGDEFGDMGRRFDRMMAELGQLIQQLQGMGLEMTQAATNLLDVNEQSTHQAEAQSGEIARMVTEMQQVQNSAGVVIANVEAANEVSLEAQGLARAGDQTVQDTVAAINNVAAIVKQAADGMDCVKRDSENIGTVLEVIKSIAEQTNLLALNAAIEAARAGEQGRGFAVVADEVRQLASRTSASTQEIQDIINTLQQGTQNASRQMLEGADATSSAVSQAQAAGESLQAILGGIDTISNRSKEIQRASDGQQEVVERVGHSTERIDQLAQDGASYSSSALDSSRTVTELARQLGARLDAFKV